MGGSGVPSMIVIDPGISNRVRIAVENSCIYQRQSMIIWQSIIIQNMILSYNALLKKGRNNVYKAQTSHEK